MKKNATYCKSFAIFLGLYLCIFSTITAQKFYTNVALPFSLNGATGSCASPGVVTPNVLSITVSGIGVLTTTNALSIVNVTLTNCGSGSKNMNLVSFRLMAPDGTCVGVYNGGLSTVGTGEHHLNLVSSSACLNNPNVANDAVSGALANVSGNYGFFNTQFGGSPIDITTVFAGKNADGVWKIIFNETTSSEPCVSNAFLGFGNPTITDQANNGEDCTTAINWIGDPICAMTNAKSGSILMPGNISNTATGTSFGTIGSSACQWNQANNNDVWIKFNPTSENVCISISGLDFNLQSLIVKDANEDGDDNPCTANPTVGVNDQRWELISCPNSAIYTTTAGTQLNQQHCFTGVVGETYYMVVDGNGGAESKFYISGVSGLPATDLCPANLADFIPDTVGIINSSCDTSNCINIPGQLTQPIGLGACPIGSTTQYSINNGSWTSSIPLYNQNGPIQSIKVRCACAADSTELSKESKTVTTNPNPCKSVVLHIDTSICEGQNILIGSNLYTTSGSFIDTLVGVGVCDSIINLSLTVLPRILNNFSVEICEGSSVTVGTNVYTTSGVYSDTLLSSSGCDSVVNLTLTVVSRIINNLSLEICEGSSVTVGTNVYTTSGVYSDTLLSSSGCDSVVNLTLTVVSRIINNLSLEICEGSSVTVGTNVYTTSGVYSDTLLSSSGCDSVVNLTLTVVSRIINNLSLEICEGSSVTVGTNVYTTSGVYSDTLLSSSGCDSVVNLTLTVVSRIINNLSLEICEGSSVTVGTNVYTTSGVYSDTLLSSSGCDSVVNLTLTVVPRIINNLSLEICEGSSVTVGTNVYTTSGVYSDTLLSSSGCDSVVNLTLTVVSRIINNLSLEICEGSSVTVGTNVYTTFGVYSDTLLSSSGCDSVVNLTLTVVSRIINNLSLEICEGSSVTVGTNVYTTSGVYSDTLLSSSGCDSVVNLTLTVVSRIINNLSLEICEGSSVTVGTNVYTTSGVYSDTLLSSSGCDSVVNLTLTVVSRIINNLSLEICEGSSVTVGTNVYTTSGVYSDTLLSSSGCDSVVNLTLTVVPRIINNLSLEKCEGSSVTVGTNVYTTSGVYSDTLLSSSGCDSVVNLTLTVVPRIINNLSLEKCEGSSVTVGTNVYTTSGVYSDTLLSSSGCDSVVNLALTVISRIINNLSLEICEGSSVTVGTNVYTTSGVYSDTLLSSSGCDSVVNLTLTVVPRIINNLSLEKCEGSSVTVGTNVYTTSGVYSDTLLSSSGCDSVVNLALTVISRIINNLSLEICEGSSVTVGTNVYTTSGVYSDTLLSSSGCDSVVNLALTVVSRIINNLSLEICEGSSVTVGTNVYTTSGVYSDTLLSSSGCDSVVNLTLTVVSRIINNLSLEICEGSSVTVGTNVYTTSGVYSDTLLSSSGCDSVVNLTLTVVSRIINNLSLEICEGSSVTVGTNVYTTSGVYSDTLLSSSGCDSVVNLTLTVVSRIINNLSLEICEGSSVTVGTNVYTTSGVYSDTLLSSSGCDSVVNLALTVVPRIINNLSLEICEGSSVTVGTNVYTTSGVYSDTLLSSSGCDSVVNLTLTVVSRIINNLSLEICEGSSVTVGTNVYTTSGVYSDTLLSSSGCDSVVNLTLTVVSRIINNLSLEICEGSSVTVGTNVYTTSGVYSDTLLSSSGCDSVVNLTLSIRSLPDITVTVDKPEVISGTLVQLNVTGVQTQNYQWQPSSLVSNSTIQNPTALIDQSTWFYVEVTDNLGCSNIDSVFVKVKDISCGEENVYIANAFTPNGDNSNDLFLVKSILPLQEMELLIFNRWGELVFESKDQLIGWDGNYKGSPAVGDTFAYYFKGICEGTIIIKKGNILIPR